MPKGRQAYDEISALVHLICFVLASGSSGSGSLPDRLVASIAIPDCWNRRGRRSFVDLGHRNAAGPNYPQTLNGLLKSEF
jgi:hypothetical protein